MSDKNKTVLEFMHQLKEMFDLGCAIEVCDDGYCIVGHNYAPDGFPETSTIEHRFEGLWKQTDDGEIIDNLSELLEKMKNAAIED